MRIDGNTSKTTKTRVTVTTTASWRIAILSVGTILLHAIAALTVDASAIMLATTVPTVLTTAAALNPSTPEFVKRSIRVGYNGNAVIICKTSDPSKTWFHEVIENIEKKPLHINNEIANHYALLLLKGIERNGTYRCMQGAKILSETMLKIAAPDLTSPEQIQIGTGDDAALVFVHDSNINNIGYSSRILPRNYSDYRDEKFNQIEVDEQTTLLLIRNASAQKSIFTFEYEDNQRSHEWELDVGKAPESVSSFQCTGYNYESMRCRMFYPPNNLPTEYKITYVALNKILHCKLDNGSFHNITLKTLNTGDYCTYIPSANFHNFTLIATNVLGEYTNKFSINTHERVIPAKLQVNVSNKTPNSVRLSWENDKKYSYERGLEYNITVEPVNFKKYNLTKYNLIKYSALLKYDFILENLSYAYWPYVVRLTARVNCNTCEWNEPTEVTFNTTERIPDRAPHTYVGGFYNYGNDTTLYWEDLPDYERNGKNFTYVIQKLDMHGQKLYDKKETKNTIVAFHWSKTPKMYKIFAKNAVGVSSNVSIIRVPPSDMNPPLEIEKLFENGAFKLKWKHPHDYEKRPPSNYTVFWCQQMLMKRTECEGPMHFKYVENTKSEYPIPSRNQLIMAVAANYPLGSSGLKWTTCFADLNASLKQITVDATVMSESSISLSWFNTNCMNAFDGYNITYCVMDNKTLPSCHSEIETFRQSRNFILTNLQPYTFYNISIQLYGANNRKSPPSTVVVRQTNEAAPAPPTNLKYMDVTSNSAKISWEAPTETHGVLQKYYIWYKKYYETEVKFNETANLSYILTDLSSGSVYEIWLTAWTSKQSIKSASINITTMIGIPTLPTDVTLNRDGGDYVLSWTAAENLGPHTVFYELIFNDHNLRQILTVQPGTGNKHECRVKYPDCREGVQNMQVRAINVVAEKDLDKSTFAIAEEEAMQRMRRLTDPAYARSPLQTQETTYNMYKYDISKEHIVADYNKKAKKAEYAYKYKTHNDFKCEPVDGSIRTQLPDMSNTRYYMLKSEPKSSPNYNCLPFPWETLAASFIFVSMFIVTILWTYNFMQRQWKVYVRFPDSVIILMSMSSKSTSCSEDNKPENISIVSTKASDGASLINIGNTSVPSSSSESGVDGVGDGGSDTPSTSSEDVNREFSRCWAKSEPASPQTTITLKSLSSSSPLRCKKTFDKPILINDDYLQAEQITPIIINDSSTSSESSYLPLHSITSKCSSASESSANKGNFGAYVTAGDIAARVSTPHVAMLNKNSKSPLLLQMTNNNNKNNINNNNLMKNAPLANNYVLPDSLHKLSTAHAEKNSVNPMEVKHSQAKAATAQSQLFPTLATGDYVLPDSLHKLPTAHMATTREDQNEAEKPLQQQFPQIAIKPAQSEPFKNFALTTDDYVLPDELPKIAASHTNMFENKKSLMPLPQQHSQSNSKHAQANIFKNMSLTNSGYLLPDTLTKFAAAQNATSDANIDDDSKTPVQQQVQPIVSYGYVTSDFWSQQNTMK
ncbi:cytokine receptor isoform X3 [Bactrocera oleae]|uniref:cytokine receptor isoform X3 n=1 Tax=Bactrocera oleae TaxID=104688 RepID=UPI00387E9A03